jgi:polyketide cyclase/dehydrase/lipid transport protein
MKQDCAMAEKSLETSTEIAAAAGALYDLVSELTKMGQWSPENVGGKWIGGATGPAVGARFKGNNKAGWRRWSTISEVTEAAQGKRFAFHVTVMGVPIADWAYEFDSTGGATKVTETWQDQRPGWMNKLSGPVMGVPDRAVHNRRNMDATLAALKKAAESA